MKVFVTGNKGHLGSKIETLLQGQGHEIVGFDKADDPVQDIGDTDLMIRAMVGCDMVVHCAAIPHPDLGGFGQYMTANVQGSVNVFAAESRNKVKRVVYLSSTGFYGCDTWGRLFPAYFPIDEAHPIASMPGRSLGNLAAYNQSKVMAEQALAWFGSHRTFEAIALRLAPANPKSWQYQGRWTWQDYCRDYRETGKNWKRGCFFSNCHPDYAAGAVVKAVEAEGPFWYEPFNICDRYTHRGINVHEFLEQEYPSVPVRSELGPHDSLVSCEKAQQELRYVPCQDLE